VFIFESIILTCLEYTVIKMRRLAFLRGLKKVLIKIICKRKRASFYLQPKDYQAMQFQIINLEVEGKDLCCRHLSEDRN